MAGDEHRLRRAVARGRRSTRLRPPPDRRCAADGARARAPAGGRRVPDADADGHARDRLLDPVERPAPEAGEQLAARLRLPDPRPRSLPRQRLLPALRARRRVPPDPVRDRAARVAGTAARRRRDGEPPARSGARDRPDRLRQVDHARLADRLHQRDARRAHHDDRGPDRVPPPAQEVHRQPARAGHRRDHVRRGA